MTSRKPPPNLVCIACAIFRDQLDGLDKSDCPDFTLRVLPSMLHMNPGQLDQSLGAWIRQEREQNHSVLLLYGDCHPHIHEQERLPGVTRVEGINCQEILLGEAQYRTLRKAGAFFLLPEWAVHWREVFETELGLTEETAKDFMRDMHTKLVYLDPGQVPVPKELLNEISRWLGLPWETLPVDANVLRVAMRTALKKLGNNDGP